MEAAFRAWWQESYGLPPGPHAVMTHVAWGEHLLRQPLELPDWLLQQWSEEAGKRQLTLLLGSIHGSVGSGIDDSSRALRSNQCRDCCPTGRSRIRRPGCSHPPPQRQTLSHTVQSNLGGSGGAEC